MKYTENAINILNTKFYKGIGRAWITKRLKGNEDVATIVDLLKTYSKQDEDLTIESFNRDKDRLEAQLRDLEGFADGLIAIGDPEFPMYRGIVKNSEQPIFLFYQGDISLLNTENKNIAVIGLLNPDIDTETIEKSVVSELVRHKITIVSGLALGCDTIAHRQALDSNGKTIAILPGPLNEIIPTSNKDLAQEIIDKKGLLISEYFDRVKSKNELSSRYQERDRLQALFSDCIILSASYSKNNLGNDSGARLAMEYALNYSIPRAVIYDEETDYNNPKYELNRQLINEQTDITIINKGNLSDKISKLILKKPSVSNQISLF